MLQKRTQTMLKFCRRYIFNTLFCVYLSTSILVGLAVLATPFLIGVIINQLAGTDTQMEMVLVCCTLIIVLQMLRALLTYFSEILYVNLQSHAGYHLNQDTLEHVKRLPQDFFKHFDAAYYNQQINHDANDLVIFIINSVAQFSSNAITLASALIVLIGLNIRLGAVCMVLGISGGALYWLFRQGLYKKSFDMQEQAARFFSRLQDQLDKIAFLRRHVLFERFQESLSRSFDELYPALLANQRINAKFSLSNSTVGAIAHGLLLVLGAYEVVVGRLQPGYLVTVVGYYASLSSSIQFFLSWGKDYQTNRVCYERLRRIWDIPEERNGRTKLSNVDSIVCKGVSFSYPGTDNVVLSNFTASFQKGCLYGISGSNGSGKSTLLEAISGMYPDNIQGSIIYDGVEQRDIDRYALRQKCVSMTEQEPPILEDTILENLTLLVSNPDIDTLNGYAAALGLREMISFSPNGLATVLDDRNQNLSGGEKQKIAIIRQLLKDADVMLFDEPTSALDFRSRKEFISILQMKRSEHLIIVVTHDDELLAACDEVLELDTPENGC